MSKNNSTYLGLSIAVLVGVAVLVALINLLLVEGPASTAGGPEAVAERIRPVGMVKVAGESSAAAPEAAAGTTAAPDGEAIYNQVCMACHAAGVSGAPKLADSEAWAPRIAKGMDMLVASAVNGIPGTAMPARGTCATCSDDDLKAVVEYMVASSGGDATAAPAETAPAGGAPAPAEPQAAAEVGGGADGEAVYNRACVACHLAGIAGAPKFGDAAAWAPRIAKGTDALLQTAISGLNAMPPRGTCMDCSDDDLAAAIQFMISNSQ